MRLQYLDLCLTCDSGQYVLIIITYNLHFVSFQEEFEAP